MKCFILEAIKRCFNYFISYSYDAYCILSRYILITFDIAPKNILFVALILIFVLIKLYKKMFYKKFFFGHNMKNWVLHIECGGLLLHIYDLAYGLHIFYFWSSIVSAYFYGCLSALKTSE